MVSAPFHGFLEIFLRVLRKIFFPSHWLLVHLTNIETMDIRKRRVNPGAMAIIYVQKKIIRAEHRTSDTDPPPPFSNPVHNRPSDTGSAASGQWNA